MAHTQNSSLTFEDILDPLNNLSKISSCHLGFSLHQVLTAILTPALFLLVTSSKSLRGIRGCITRAAALTPFYGNTCIYRSPCEQVLEKAERYNQENAHENRGALSRRAGFAPAVEHQSRLPPLFQPWETVANGMDLLLHTQTVRAAVESMPLLCAESDILPDRYLVRASIILSHLAYIYVNGHVRTRRERKNDPPETFIPESVRVPWYQVCRRMGRQEAFMTYTDAVSSSHIRDQSLPIDEAAIDNIQPLIHFQRTQQSVGFLGTMFETVALAQPVLCDVIAAHRAVLNSDAGALTKAIASINMTVSHVRHVTIPKLSPQASSRYYVNPIAWVKSVANLGIHWPEIKHIPGPSGTGHPFFHLMDVFIGRKSYSGIMGREAEKTRDNLPQHWREFFTAVEHVSVADFVGRAGDVKLKAQWNELCEVYAGHDGLLGFHKRKVFGYLYIAFRVGRSSTINGFSGNTRQEPWNMVADALDEARRQRILDEEEDAGEQRPNDQLLTRDVSVSSLLKHTKDSTGYWIAARGRVYDITNYIRHHPGGHHILYSCAGRDVTQDLETVRHLDDPKIRTLINRYVRGKLYVHTLPDPKLQAAYNISVALGYQINDLASTFHNHSSFIECRLSGLDVEGTLNPFKINIYHDMEEHLRIEVVAAMVAYSRSHLKSFCEIIPTTLTGDVTRLTEMLDRIEHGQEDCPPDIETLSVFELRRLIGINTEYFSAMQADTVSVVELFESLPAAAEKLNKTQAERIAGLMESLLDKVARLGRAR